jgi:addiction module RelB/DinJ family antitoxin
MEVSAERFSKSIILFSIAGFYLRRNGFLILAALTGQLTLLKISQKYFRRSIDICAEFVYTIYEVMMMATKSINLNIRVDPEVKAKADSILKEMGLTATQLYNLLLSQVVITRRVPFPIVASPTPQYAWLQNFEQDRAEAHAAVANGTAKIYNTTAELFAEWDREDAEDE